VGVFITPAERLSEQDGLALFDQTVDDPRFAAIGKIITSVGVSAGINVAPHVVRRRHGEEVARRAARDLEYHSASEPEAGKRAM
jgi:transcriptional regulator GlxA family with amidase domain